MVNIKFKSHYKILHFTNEIGKYIIGGIASFINEHYGLHDDSTGFVYFYDEIDTRDIVVEKFPGDRNILAISYREINRIKDLKFDIAVVHFYGLSFIADKEISKNKKLIYVVHSVPTPEPYFFDNPFGGNFSIKNDFEKMCNRADLIVCVSYAEKKKLERIYPEYTNKIRVIHNGIRFEKNSDYISEIKNERKKFGFLGRLDYRKGLRECIKQFKDIDGELYIACGKEDHWYMSALIDYIEGAELKDKIHFLGWCQGERKKSFLHSLDALIIPSLYEPFGYVVLEGIKEQIPLISSRGGGIGEIIADYKYSYEPYEENSLKKCIQRFQKDTVIEIEREIKKLQKRKELFTTEIMLKKYNELFESI